MKKKFLTVALAATMAVSSAFSAFAATPVYTNDFENGVGDATIVGTGAIEDDADSHFGKIFHNAVGGQQQRSNYLLLPEDVLSKSAETKQLTISFWVNVGTATEYFWTPIFSAYGAAPVDNANTWPMFILQSRLLAQVNCAGYTDYALDDYKLTPAQDDTGADIVPIDTSWLDDGKWHLYTAVADNTSMKIYVDGTLMRYWESDGTDGHNQAGLFSNGADLKYICLGGNQAWNWGDVDPAYKFDDVAIYNTALSENEIKAIMTAKTTDTVPGNDAPAADAPAADVTPETTTVAAKTGDGVSTTALVVLAAVACGAVVLSKKNKVTE